MMGKSSPAGHFSESGGRCKPVIDSLAKMAPERLGERVNGYNLFQ
jgi:hypothetical protein